MQSIEHQIKSKRDIIKEGLCEYYDMLIHKFEHEEIIQTTDLITVKFLGTDTGYITLVDIKCEEHVTPAHFLKFYEVCKIEAVKITPECTGVRELCVEEGKYKTSVETFKFPLVSERYAVLTAYHIPNYGGEGMHMYVASDRGNEDRNTEEFLGKGYVGSRVYVHTEIAVYHCIKKDGKIYMRWLTEIGNKGIPQWIFLKLQLMKYPGLFKGIYSVLARPLE